MGTDRIHALLCELREAQEECRHPVVDYDDIAYLTDLVRRDLDIPDVVEGGPPPSKMFNDVRREL